MPLPRPDSDRFDFDDGFRVVVQVPAAHAQGVIDALLDADPLTYGDYDRVTFETAVGVQKFRALGTGRNAATAATVAVPCSELSFYVRCDDEALARILDRIYWAHPYEEPVIFVMPALRCLHIRGLDEDNPNRFWNRPAEAWIPPEHR